MSNRTALRFALAAMAALTGCNQPAARANSDFNAAGTDLGNGRISAGANDTGNAFANGANATGQAISHAFNHAFGNGN